MHLLELPFFYNSLRRIIAGDQIHTKSFVRSHLAANHCTSVIDIGCGTGDFFDPALPLASYTGIDLNAAYISYAQNTYRAYPHATFVCDNILTSPCITPGYDAVLFISMMHHLDDNGCEKIFQRIASLRPKIIIIADIIPNPAGVVRQCMVRLDRGRYVRKTENKRALIERYFSILHTELIPSRLAVQYGAVCRPLA